MFDISTIGLDAMHLLLQTLRAIGLLWPTIIVTVMVAVFLWCFALLFIAAMGIYRLHLNGKLYERTRVRWFTRVVICYPAVALGFTLDVVAQYTVAAILFREWPPSGEHLVTDRLQRYMRTAAPGSRRWDWANTICTELDLFDPTGDHCNRGVMA